MAPGFSKSTEILPGKRGHDPRSLAARNQQTPQASVKYLVWLGALLRVSLALW